MKKHHSPSLMRSAVLVALVAAIGMAFGVVHTVVHAQSHSSISFSNYSLSSGSDPWGTAFDSNGNVWVAAPGCDPQPQCSGTAPGKLDVFDSQNNQWSKTITVPAQPLFIAFDQSGRAWFTMPMANSIGVYNPSSGSLKQFALPTSGAGPWDIAVDHKGNVWVTEHYGYKVAEFNPSSGNFHEFATTSTASQPYGITVDANDNIWFTENPDTVARIGEITANGTLNEYLIRNGNTAGTGLTPHMITVDNSGNVWWSEGWVSSIGELRISAAHPGTNNGVTEYHYTPNGGSHTSGISTDKHGLVWVSDALQNTVGYFDGNSFTFATVPGSDPHPHDGLNVDSSGTVWFDEEFSNQLGQVN